MPPIETGSSAASVQDDFLNSFTYPLPLLEILDVPFFSEPRFAAITRIVVERRFRRDHRQLRIHKSSPASDGGRGRDGPAGHLLAQ